MKRKILVVILTFLFTFVLMEYGATQDDIDSQLTYTENNDEGGSINWTKQILRIKGNGFGPERIKSLGRRKILAKRAAKLDAYRNLIEVIKGVHITSNTTVEDMMLQSDIIKSNTVGMLKGMKVVDVTYSDDGGCEITVEVNINQNGDFLLSALNNNEIKVTDNYPKFDWVELRNRLEQTEQELASTRSNLNKTKNRLANTSYALKQTKEKLKNANISKQELAKSLETIKSELAKTDSIIDGLKDDLNDKKLKLAVNDKELSLTKEFLTEKKSEVKNLYADLKDFSNNFSQTNADKARLLGYVDRIKEVQSQATGRVNSLYGTNSTPLSGQNNGAFTGLLIDARSLNLKPALAPSVINENNSKLYGIGTIPKVTNGGAIVDYIAGDINKAKMYSKIGNSPLIVKGIKNLNGSDIMVSNHDSERMLSILELLKQKKVAILL